MDSLNVFLLILALLYTAHLDSFARKPPSLVQIGTLTPLENACKKSGLKV